uniref:Splicing factor U2AF 35 kDa subunit n=1 Tax=Parascaris univalens TaxID=6257 RepID=A0A915AQD1_PARUN
MDRRMSRGYQQTEDLSGAEYLASIYGTEKDKVNCSFYFKVKLQIFSGDGYVINTLFTLMIFTCISCSSTNSSLLSLLLLLPSVSFIYQRTRLYPSLVHR